MLFGQLKQINKQNNFMHSQQAESSQTPHSHLNQPPLNLRQPPSKYHQLLARMQQQPFSDDTLFFDKLDNKKHIIHIGHSKKIKTIYHKIILSNKSDPLHPSSYRKFQSRERVGIEKSKAGVFGDRENSIGRRFNDAGEGDKGKGGVLGGGREGFRGNTAIEKEEQNGHNDRKRFFRNLLKKFTDNGDQDMAVNSKQKIHLFRKMFEHYKIKPQEKQRFQEVLKKLAEKQAQSAYSFNSKISTKMTLQQRRNNYSVSQRRREDQSHNLRLRMKDKGTKTSQQRRTLKQGVNLSELLSIESRRKCASTNQHDSHPSTHKPSQLANHPNQHLPITQLQQQLSARKADYKTVQQESHKLSSFNHSQHRTRIVDKKINFRSVNQSLRQQTPIDIKLQKFREFLFAVNFSNHLFVPLEVDRYPAAFKIYVGKGNNSNLIKAIFKKRFWFEVTKNISEANLVWTQLKEEHVFQKQQGTKYLLEEPKVQEIDIEEQLINKTQMFDVDIDEMENRKTGENPEETQKGEILEEKETSIDFDTTKNQSSISYQQNKLVDFKSLRLKERPNLQKFISVESERMYRSQKKADKSLISTTSKSKDAVLKENAIKMKKYPQLLVLKNSNILVKDPLHKILSSSQMKEYNQLYAKYLKNPSKLPGTKIPTFQQRRKDIMTSVNGQFIKQEKKFQTVVQNHLPFNGILGNKKAMFYILRQYCQLIDRDPFTTIPLTYHIKQGLKDEQYKKFAQQFENRKKSNRINYWVMKPGEFSNRGNGIECTNKIEQIRKRIQQTSSKPDPKRPTLKAPHSPRSIILQTYITDLLLYNGRKFDIRTYMMVTSTNGKLKAYWYEQGYIRTSSYMWNLNDISDRQIHLTNDAVQKYSDTYGKYEMGNKLSYRDIQRYLETNEKAGKNVVYERILPQMKEIAALSLKASYLFLDPAKLQNNFEIFGFDFMLDSKLKPWLIEINTNPCLELGCPILERIIPNMLENAFRIAIDPLFPPPSSFSSNYKYNIAENAVIYNKFDLIFDEDRDGPQIRKLYQNKSLEEILTNIQDIQEDKETFQEDGEEIDLSERN